MATPTVLTPKPKMVSANSVKGYRPPWMAAQGGFVISTGPARPGGGYAANMPTKTPGAILKPKAGGVPDQTPVKRAAKRITTTPPNRLGLKGRAIVPHNGVSLANSNGAGI
jgi:hypothetical protein